MSVQSAAPTPDLDTLAHLLAVERRRLTIDAVATGPLTLRELAERLARERSGSATGQAYKRERIQLHQKHLPKLAANGIVDYDDEAGGIARGPRFEAARETLAALREVAGDD